MVTKSKTVVVESTKVEKIKTFVKTNWFEFSVLVLLAITLAVS